MTQEMATSFLCKEKTVYSQYTPSKSVNSLSKSVYFRYSLSKSVYSQYSPSKLVYSQYSPSKPQKRVWEGGERLT